MSAPEKLYVNHDPADGEVRVYKYPNEATSDMHDYGWTGWDEAVEYVRADIVSEDEATADRQADEACDLLVTARKELEEANKRADLAEANWAATRQELEQARMAAFKLQVNGEALLDRAAALTQTLAARG